MTWIRARRCETNGCAEVSPVDGGVLLRSSRRLEQVVVLDTDEWAAFLAAVKSGDFDEVAEGVTP